MRRILMSAVLAAICAMPAMATEFPDCDAPSAMLSPLDIRRCQNIDPNSFEAFRNRIGAAIERAKKESGSQNDPHMIVVPATEPKAAASEPPKITDPRGTISLCPASGFTYTPEMGCQPKTAHRR